MEREDSYEEALEAAGAKVIASERFGSYQGDLWCLVEYNGEIGWVTMSYGSCSGCDNFLSTFGYYYEDKPDYMNKLKEFGLTFLDVLLTQEQALKEASENLDWDGEAKNMVNFIESEWQKHRNKL